MRQLSDSALALPFSNFFFFFYCCCFCTLENFFFLATQGGFKTALCGSLHEFRQPFVFTGEGKAQVATGSRNVNVLNRVLASQVPFEALFFLLVLFFFFSECLLFKQLCVYYCRCTCVCTALAFPSPHPFRNKKKNGVPAFLLSLLCISHVSTIRRKCLLFKGLFFSFNLC